MVVVSAASRDPSGTRIKPGPKKTTLYSMHKEFLWVSVSQPLVTGLYPDTVVSPSERKSTKLNSDPAWLQLQQEMCDIKNFVLKNKDLAENGIYKGQ